MSFEDEVSRLLRARAASARAAPDVEDLAARIRTRSRTTERRHRIVLMSASLVLATSLGGLVGALASVPPPRTAVISPLGGVAGARRTTASGSHIRMEPGALPTQSASRPVVVSFEVGGVTVQASRRALANPVAVTAGGREVACASAALVSTTVTRPGSFAGGAAVVGLPVLSAGGLEIVESGALPTETGGFVWWLTAAVGSSVAKVAAQLPGGQIVTGTPSSGLVVLAGTEPAGTSAASVMSAVAETAQGGTLSSLWTPVGAVPYPEGEAVNQSPGGGRSSCSIVSMPASPATRAASRAAPSDPALAAAQVIAAFETQPPAGTTSGIDVSSGTEGGVSAATAGAGAPFVVRQVSFLSGTRADVVYRLRTSSVWQVARAALSAGGRWEVTR